MQTSDLIHSSCTSSNIKWKKNLQTTHRMVLAGLYVFGTTTTTLLPIQKNSFLTFFLIQKKIVNTPQNSHTQIFPTTYTF